jgi:prefoldin subunit 5
VNLVLDELIKAQRYHLKQLEENVNKIKFHEEAVVTLKKGNENHRQILEQIGQALDILEKVEQDGRLIQPIGNDYTDSIPQKEVI